MIISQGDISENVNMSQIRQQSLLSILKMLKIFHKHSIWNVFMVEISTQLNLNFIQQKKLVWYDF